MATFSEIKTALGEITERIVANGKRLARGKAEIDAAEADLAGMGATYGPIIAAAKEAAVASPHDLALGTAKAEADLLVAEFGTLKNKAKGMKDALAALEK